MERTHHNGYIFFKSGIYRQKIVLDNILYAEGMKNWCKIHTPEGSVVIKSTMKDLLSTLGADFMQVHKSFIVSIDKVEYIKGRKIKICGADIPVGRLFWPTLLGTINNEKDKYTNQTA